jgi:hypothetical protein
MHTCNRRVYPPLPHPRAALRLPPHSPLRTVRQWLPCQQHRQSTRAAQCAPSTTTDQRRRGCQCRPTACTLPSLPVLRRPHDHHREVRARRNPALPSERANASDQDRHVMMSSRPPNYRYPTPSCWFAARRSQARIHPLNSQTAALANTPHSPQRVHSHQLAHTDCTAKSSLHVSLSQLATAARVPKSP